MRYRGIINARLTRPWQCTHSSHQLYQVGDILRLHGRGYLRVERVSDDDPTIVHGWLAAHGYAGCFASVTCVEVAEHVACEWPRRAQPAAPTRAIH